MQIAGTGVVTSQSGGVEVQAGGLHVIADGIVTNSGLSVTAAGAAIIGTTTVRLFPPLNLYLHLHLRLHPRVLPDVCLPVCVLLRNIRRVLADEREGHVHGGCCCGAAARVRRPVHLVCVRHGRHPRQRACAFDVGAADAADNRRDGCPFGTRRTLGSLAVCVVGQCVESSQRPVCTLRQWARLV